MKVALAPEKLGEQVDDGDAMARVRNNVETKASSIISPRFAIEGDNERADACVDCRRTIQRRLTILI